MVNRWFKLISINWKMLKSLTKRAHNASIVPIYATYQWYDVSCVVFIVLESRVMKETLVTRKYRCKGEGKGGLIHHQEKQYYREMSNFVSIMWMFVDVESKIMNYITDIQPSNFIISWTSLLMLSIIILITNNH